MTETQLDALFPLDRTRARILRVNAAGEAGAIAIYRAQLLARAVAPRAVVTFLEDALAHERSHYLRFKACMVERDIRECPGTMLWVAGGWVLGLISLLGGTRGIMACTAAIEVTVHGHLEEQIAYLGSRDPGLARVIADIEVEEEQHLQAGLDGYDPNCTAARAFIAVIRAITEALICVATFGDSIRMKRAL